MATIKKIGELLEIRKAIYPLQTKDVNVQNLTKKWTALLKEYSDKAVEIAFCKCLQTCKTPPILTDIIEILDFLDNDLSLLAEPLKKHLLDNYHMNCAVIITADNVKVVEVKESIPL